MRQDKPLACLVHYGLRYYAMPAPAESVMETVAACSGSLIGAVVELSDDNLALGSVPPAVVYYAFLILALPKGVGDAIREDCANYVQRTLGKTLQGVVWIEGRGETQQVWSLQGRLSHDDPRVFAPSGLRSDGVHYTVELKRRDADNVQWELMESSWECPSRFEDEGEAEVVARNLALRHENDMDTRVVSPTGVVLATFGVRKYLSTRRRGVLEAREDVSSHSELPMLHEVLEGYRAGKSRPA